MINDLLARSITAFLFRADIESAPQWLSEKREKEMQRLKKKTEKEKKEKQKLLLLSRMELLGSDVTVCIVTTDDTEST